MLLTLAFELVILRRIADAFDEVKAHEEEMRLTLLLNDTVRDQFMHGASFALTRDDAQRLAHDEARERVERTLRELMARVDEHEPLSVLQRIGQATAELDSAFRTQIVPAVQRSDPGAASLYGRQSAVVTAIDGDIRRVFAFLQQATSAFQAQLDWARDLAYTWTAVLLVVCPLLLIAIGVYASHFIARPLALLARGAAAVGGGNLDTRISIAAPDEFGAVAKEFNAMTIALKQHQERLVASEKLAAVGRVAAGMAHELNNPLQVILGYLSLNRDVADPVLAGQLAAAEEEAVRCKEIVEGVLEISRPSLRMNIVPVDVRQLCEEVADGLRVSLPPASRRPAIQGDARALADRGALRRVICNVLRNAVEAAGPGGDVGVSITTSAEQVQVNVVDSGPGILPEARARLFEPFFTTKADGTGLGLALSRASLRAIGGDIEASVPAAGGAAFTLRLPKAAAHG